MCVKYNFLEANEMQENQDPSNFQEHVGLQNME